MISIIVPTYREAENLPLLSEAVKEALKGRPEPYEIVFVDDDSRDGSEEICAELAKAHPVRMVIRRGERGLATAVLRGIEATSGAIIVVMDADLSHPAGAIPAMVERLESGRSDFVLGSRYAEGGSIEESWSVFRRLNSRMASLLARPLCALKDPMSGFFALYRKDMPGAGSLFPIGYKIALELLVRGDFQRPSELPIHFAERRFGQSKLSSKQQVDFVRHLARLYAHKLRIGASVVWRNGR